MVSIKGKGNINDNKSISGDNNSIDSHTIDGSYNILSTGEGSNIHIHSSFPIKESPMYQLLNNIGNLPMSEPKVELPDLVPYTIEEKISYNELEIYRDFYNDFQDGNYVIKDKIALIEETSNANFGNNICRYIQSKFREVFLDLRKTNNSVDGDHLIENLKKKVTFELKEYYQEKLSPEELVYIDYVIYYVFTQCKIFKKPPKMSC